MTQKSIGGGLHNLGNTCFFNAAMQCVLHSPPLQICLTNHIHSKQCILKSKNQWCAFCEMQNIYTRTRDVRSYSPNNMVNHLRNIFKKFKLGRQEDSHEFLRYLIEGMQQCETSKLGKDREYNESKIKSTQIFDIFGGIIKTCVDCLNCGFRSLTNQRYYDFNIRKECQRSNTLLEGINSFFTVEKLEGHNKYLCEKCKIRSNARKRFLIQTAPKVATFQFKRFTNFLRKIGKFIQYPLTIDLGKYLEQPRKVVYKLFGVIVHAGGASWSGHYYSFIRRGQSWFKMDDSYVAKCSPQSAMGQNAYILFYEKVYEDAPQSIPEPMAIEQSINTKPTLETKKEKSQPVIAPVAKLVEKMNDEKTKQISKQQSLIKGVETIIHKDEKQINQKEKIFEQIQLITHKKLTAEQKQTLQKIIKPQNSDEDYQDLVVPQALVRRRSKEQFEHQIPYQQLLMHTITRIFELNSKTRGLRPRNTALRHTYDLRKYETVMQKKRKLG